MQRFQDQGLLRRRPAVHWHHDGGAQAVVLVQPFPGDPVIDGAAEGGGEVLAEDRRRAVQDVADGVAGVEGVERLRFSGGKSVPALPLAGFQSGRALIGALGGRRWRCSCRGRGRASRHGRANTRPRQGTRTCMLGRAGWMSQSIAPGAGVVTGWGSSWVGRIGGRGRRGTVDALATPFRVAHCSSLLYRCISIARH